MRTKKRLLLFGVLVVGFLLAGVFAADIGTRNEEPMREDDVSSVVIEGGESMRIREESSVRQAGEKDLEMAIRDGDGVAEELPPVFVDHDIPFTAQAPLAQWGDPVFQNGCEEASLLMAERFAEGAVASFDPNETSEAIRELARQEEALLGESRDLSAQDTARAARELLNLDARLEEANSPEDIAEALQSGAVVIVPANGRLLGNPHFTPPGPVYHMLLVRGYDSETDEFITNDPGTRYGEGYRYASETLFGAMHDYETGHHGEIFPERKAMIVIAPNEGMPK